MKKIISITLAGILATGLLASCGTPKETETKATDSPVATSVAGSDSSAAPDAKETEKKATEEKGKSSEENKPKAEGKVNESIETEKPQTAEEAANDTETIERELADIEDLILNGDYDDAYMQVQSLMTKNLSEGDKELIQKYYDRLKEKVSSGLTD